MQQAAQPGIGQKFLNDPITQQLLSGLAKDTKFDPRLIMGG